MTLSSNLFQVVTFSPGNVNMALKLDLINLLASSSCMFLIWLLTNSFYAPLVLWYPQYSPPAPQFKKVDLPSVCCSKNPGPLIHNVAIGNTNAFMIWIFVFLEIPLCFQMLVRPIVDCCRDVVLFPVNFFQYQQSRRRRSWTCWLPLCPLHPLIVGNTLVRNTMGRILKFVCLGVLSWIWKYFMQFQK